MAKALSQSDVVFEAERWAASVKKLNTLEAAREAEIEPLTARYEAAVASINEMHDGEIDKLQKKADEHEARVVDWLNTKKKTTKLETKSAVAEIVHGTKAGPRIIDPQKLIALCKKKSVDLWQMVNVLVGAADKLLGKKEVDAISTNETTPTKTVTLKLK